MKGDGFGRRYPIVEASNPARIGRRDAVSVSAGHGPSIWGNRPAGGAVVTVFVTKGNCANSYLNSY